MRTTTPVQESRRTHAESTQNAPSTQFIFNWRFLGAFSEGIC